MPGSGAEASYGDLLMTSIAVLAAVCVAAFVVVKLVGRFVATGRMRGAHLLDVVARVPLEPRRSLYVVEVAGKTLLVGTSEMGLSVLSELDGAEVRARAVPKQSFGDMVRAAVLGRGSVPAGRRAVPAAATAAGDAPGDVPSVVDASSMDAASVGATSATSVGSASVGAISAASVGAASAAASRGVNDKREGA